MVIKEINQENLLKIRDMLWPERILLIVFTDESSLIVIPPEFPGLKNLKADPNYESSFKKDYIDFRNCTWPSNNKKNKVKGYSSVKNVCIVPIPLKEMEKKYGIEESKFYHQLQEYIVDYINSNVL